MSPFLFKSVIAHGALGYFDELFVLLAVGIFAVMLVWPIANAWLRRDEEEETPTAEAESEKPANTPDHFRLD
jgi:hypothetical protein